MSSSDSIFQSQETTVPYVITGGKSDPFFPVLRTSFEEARQADIIVAFTQDSGLRLLQTAILDALDRGAHIRILTSNYLHITQASALQRLLDWKEQSLLRSSKGLLEVQIFEAKKQSFHPKAWFFKNTTEKYAFVGSSNWSFSALCTGIEWNVRLNHSSSPQAFVQLESSFQELWSQASALSIEWLNKYTQECKDSPKALLPLGEVQLDSQKITPTPIQEEALEALSASVKNKHRRGLFVLATGLGKTFLSAFSARELQATRILFLVHRKEILLQASSSFRQVFPHHSFGWCIDNRLEQTGDITFASVQKLSRTEHLSQFDRHFFDLIIIDEVHHAAASSYQRIIHHFSPQYLLGLTATPNRSDHLDILPLFDDHIIYQADLWVGIERKLLVPFQYVGRLDSLNYQSYTRRDGSLDIEKVDVELQNTERMDLVWKYCQEYTGKRTIFFCSTIAHATFCAEYLRTKGMAVVSVHSGANSAPRLSSIEALRRGRLQAIAAVDLFNEGIDIPEIDRIVMLRPTSSPVLFLQQLGRGLRVSPQKDQLLVIDIIGNHRSFASRIHSILSLSLQNDFGLWAQGRQEPNLPPHCSFDIELGVLEFFASDIPTQKNPSLELLQQYHFIKGERPSLSSLTQLGAKHSELLGKTSSWFAFLGSQNLLSQEEQTCYEAHKEWFEMLERTPIKKSFKLIALQAFIQEKALSTGIEINHFCQTCYQNMFSSELLRSDIPRSKRFPSAWKTYWIKWLHSIWEKDRAWIVLQSDAVWINFSFVETSTLYQMSWELLQYRLLIYRMRPSVQQSKQFLATVQVHKNKYSILFSETTPKHFNITSPNGSNWQFKTNNSSIYGRNNQAQLHHFLKDLFQQNIQNTSKKLHLYLENFDEQWFAQPVEGIPPRFIDRIEVPYFTSISELSSQNIKQFIRLPHQNSTPFTSFAYPAPNTIDFIQQTDLILCQKIDTILAKQCQHKYVLLQTHPNQPIQIAKVQAQGSSFVLLLASTTIPFPPTAKIWGLVEHVIPLTSLMPLVGTKILFSEFSTKIGISETPNETFQIIDGLPLLILRNQEPPVSFEHDKTFVFAFHKRRKYFLYLGLWFWDGQKWDLDFSSKED